MFTGLVECVGTVVSIWRAGQGARIRIDAKWPDGDVAPGDSVSVDGACLTVARASQNLFEADISPETLSRTVFGNVVPGTKVNLERALKAGQRIGGHLVQGHVDAVVTVLALAWMGGFARMRVELPSFKAKEVVYKGSVALNGVSLTVCGLGPGWFEVELIPETLDRTNLRFARSGSKLHLETDIIAKYVVRMLEVDRSREKLGLLLGNEEG